MRTLSACVLTAALVACGPRPRQPPPAPPAPPVEAIELYEGDVDAFTSDGDAAYWVVGDSVWRRGFADRAATELAALPDAAGVAALARHGDRLFVLGESGVAAMAAAGGALVTLSDRPVTGAFEIDDDGVWLADGAELVHVGLAPGAAGPEVRDLDELGEIFAVTTDRDHVYVATLDVENEGPGVGENVPAMAVWRLAKRGRDRTRIARRQYGVTGLVRRGDRLYWGSHDAALMSAPAAGGRLRVELGGVGARLAADDAGMIVVSGAGVLAEVVDRRARVGVVTGTMRPTPWRPVTVAGRGVVAQLEDTIEGTYALWRLPRPATVPDAPTVVAWPYYRVGGLAVDGDHLYVLDQAGSYDQGSRPSRIMRVDRRGGRARVVAAAPTIERMAVAGGRVAYTVPPSDDGDGDDVGDGAAADGVAVWLVDGDQPPRALTRTEVAIGLTVGRESIYWVTGDAIMRLPIRGGTPAPFHEPGWASGGSGDGRADLVIDGDAVYYSSLGWGAAGVFRARGGPSVDTLLDEPEQGQGDSLVRAGDDLYVVVGQDQVWRVPISGATPARVFGAGEETSLVGLAGGGPVVWALAEGDQGDLLAIDPATGRARTRLRVAPSELVPFDGLTADDDAAYLYLAETAWVVRVPR